MNYNQTDATKAEAIPDLKIKAGGLTTATLRVFAFFLSW